MMEGEKRIEVEEGEASYQHHLYSPPMKPTKSFFFLQNKEIRNKSEFYFVHCL